MHSLSKTPKPERRQSGSSEEWKEEDARQAQAACDRVNALIEEANERKVPLAQIEREHGLR